VSSINTTHNPWEEIPLRFVCKLNPSISFDDLDEDEDLTFLPMEKVKSGYFVPHTDKLSKHGSSYTAFENGDIILAKVTPCFENGNIAIAIGLVGGKGFGSSELFVIRPTAVDRRFLFYYFQSSDFKQDGEASMTGAGGLKRVSPDVLRQHHLPYPCQDIQRLIANYLDRETARIDKLIAEKERMQALLDEKRSALISRVVTRGLDPNAPLKPSGLEWLGEIPGDWGLWRLKHLASEALLYGANEAALEDNQDWPRFIRITDIGENGALKDETFKSLSPDVAEPFLLIDGDLLLARSGATVGKSFIYRQSWGAACFAGYLIRFRCDFAKALPDYLYLFAQSSAYWHQVSTGMIQATIQNFSAEKYGEIVVPLPPVKVQEKIVATLATTQTRFDSLTQEIRRSVAFLKERRAALISSAVTGLIPLEDMAR
jgi:type I restriction enzyme S subunit